MTTPSETEPHWSPHHGNLNIVNDDSVQIPADLVAWLAETKDSMSNPPPPPPASTNPSDPLFTRVPAINLGESNASILTISSATSSTVPLPSEVTATYLELLAANLRLRPTFDLDTMLGSTSSHSQQPQLSREYFCRTHPVYATLLKAMENLAISMAYNAGEDADERLLKAYHDPLVISPFVHAAFNEVVAAHSEGVSNKPLEYVNAATTKSVQQYITDGILRHLDEIATLAAQRVLNYGFNVDNTDDAKAFNKALYAYLKKDYQFLMDAEDSDSKWNSTLRDIYRDVYFLGPNSMAGRMCATYYQLPQLFVKFYKYSWRFSAPDSSLTLTMEALRHGLKTFKRGVQVSLPWGGQYDLMRLSQLKDLIRNDATISNEVTNFVEEVRNKSSQIMPFPSSFPSPPLRTDQLPDDSDSE